MEPKETGTLYLVATPIGNLEDITFRALRILKEVALIGAEDTRQSRKLLSYYQINTPLTSYHEHNKEAKGKQLTDKLLAGLDVALVSDAGLPGISDPGRDLVQLAVARGIKVVPVPGANAALTGLVASGLDTEKFLFCGFLPRRTKEREEQLAQLRNKRETVILYEAPHRLRAMLTSLVKCWHGGQVVIARELTKKFEEFVRGTAEQVREHFQVKEPRGEITIILAGNEQVGIEQFGFGWPGGEDLPVIIDRGNPAEMVLELVGKGQPKNEAIKAVSKKLNLPRRELYQQVVQAEGKGKKQKSDS